MTWSAELEGRPGGLPAGRRTRMERRCRRLRDQRWSDALAVVSLIAPPLLPPPGRGAP